MNFTNQDTAYGFAKTELDIAKETDLPDLLSHLGYQVRRLGNYYTTKEMDSIRIKDRRSWKRYSTGQGGDAITFLQEFCDKDFREAVEYLLDYHGRARDSPQRAPSREETPKEKAPFVLPTPNWDQRRVFAYLQKRCIAPQVIQDFIQTGLLYEDAYYHNCVFVGKDGGGKPRFASKRGTYDLDGQSFKRDVAGSDKNIAFPLPCDPALDWVAVFEAPIDLMSFCTLHRQVRSNAIALCGLYEGGLDTYLKDNPHLKRIILCLDADAPSYEATQKLTAKYKRQGYEVSTRMPDFGKDWNDYLQQRKNGRTEPEIRNFEKKEAERPMADLEKLVTEKTAADTQWKEQRKAEREAANDLRDASVTEITTNPEAFARYLEIQADNPLSSAGNVALVMVQMPEATLFGTRSRWKEQGRYVLDAEKDHGAKIFTKSPSGWGYTLSDAYDVTQTQGREVKTLQLQDNTKEMETALNALLRYSPVPVAIDRELSTAALYDPVSKQVTISPGYSDSQAFSAIAAEIAHARYHDRGYNPDYSRAEYDLSAQSVSYILCRRFGIEREQPDLSTLNTIRQVGRRALDEIQGMSKRIGSAIEKSIAPPQRAAPAMRRDAR